MIQSEEGKLREIVNRTGAYCLSRFNDRDFGTLSEKSKGDFASDVDRSAETMLRTDLSLEFGTLPVVGEEQGGDMSRNCWIVDPLDGTTNFLNGLPIWAVSVARFRLGVPDIACISLPSLGVSISATRGKGITQHGPWPGRSERGSELFGVGRNGFWDDHQRISTERRLQEEGYSLLCLGSCASSMALCAAGVLAGYIEEEIEIWDCAAGILLCNEAGIATRYSTDRATGRTSVWAGATSSK